MDNLEYNCITLRVLTGSGISVLILTYNCGMIVDIEMYKEKIRLIQKSKYKSNIVDKKVLCSGILIDCVSIKN